MCINLLNNFLEYQLYQIDYNNTDVNKKFAIHVLHLSCAAGIDKFVLEKYYDDIFNINIITDSQNDTKPIEMNDFQ